MVLLSTKFSVMQTKQYFLWCLWQRKKVCDCKTGWNQCGHKQCGCEYAQREIIDGCISSTFEKSPLMPKKKEEEKNIFRTEPHLGRETEAAFGLHHLLHHVALDARRAHVLVDNAVLQVHVVHRHADQRQLVGEGESAQPVVCRRRADKRCN